MTFHYGSMYISQAGSQYGKDVGVINAMKKEKDGDYHIQLQLDPGQPRFLNQRNMDAQDGCLVLEIICYNKVTQPDAVDACKSCPENVTIPKKGDHVQVTGSFVKDLEANHGWNEIHPVSAILAASGGVRLQDE